jgi:hypothetical protein
MADGRSETFSQSCLPLQATTRNNGNDVPPPRYGNLPTDGLTTDLATANWGTGGGGSSATGTRPIDESALSRGEMADARPTSGRVDATPGAVRLQGGTSTSVIAHPTQGPNQRHQHRLSQNGEPAINAGQQYQAEGGLRAPGENQIPNGTARTPIPPIERDADPPPPPPDE